MTKAVAELPHRSRSEVLEVTYGMSGVFTTELNLSCEREVVADENPGTCHETGRVALVVGVPETDNPRVVGDLLTREPHLEDSEVTRSIMAEGMDR